MTIHYRLKNAAAVNRRAKYLLGVLDSPEKLAMYAARVEVRLEMLAKATQAYLDTMQPLHKEEERAVIEQLKKELSKGGTV